MFDERERRSTQYAGRGRRRSNTFISAAMLDGMPPRLLAGPSAVAIATRAILAAWLGAAGTAEAAESYALQWDIGTLGGRAGQRIPMLVSADIDGHACPMQLDTGANEAVIWHQYRHSKGRSPDARVAFAGIARTVPITVATTKRLKDCKAGQAIGTLGNAFFEHGTLSIDLKASTLTFTPGSTLATRPAAQPMFYAAWGATGGHPLVEIRRGEVLQGYALLDTGSVALGLGVLSAEQWDRTTGGSPLRAGGRVRSFSITAWGREVACYATDEGADFLAGAHLVRAPTISFCPELDFHPPLKLDGVLGMRPFRESILTLDYVAGRWLVEEAK
jgi:hypothetical protein